MRVAFLLLFALFISSATFGQDISSDVSADDAAVCCALDSDSIEWISVEVPDEDPMAVKIDSVYSIGDTTITIKSVPAFGHYLEKSYLLSDTGTVLKKFLITYNWNLEIDDWALMSRTYIEKDKLVKSETIVNEYWDRYAEEWTPSTKIVIARQSDELATVKSLSQEWYMWNADLNSFRPISKTFASYDSNYQGGLDKRKKLLKEGYGWDSQIGSLLPKIRTVVYFTDSLTSDGYISREEYKWDENSNSWEGTTRLETILADKLLITTSYMNKKEEYDWQKVAKLERVSSLSSDPIYYEWDDKNGTWNVSEESNNYNLLFDPRPWKELEQLILLDND